MKRVPRITKHCEQCNAEFQVTLAKSSKRFCSKACVNAHYRESGMYAGKNNPAAGKIYRSKSTHPEWAASIAKTCVERGINVGDKNGMKDPEVAARMSKTRRECVTSDPAYRKACSDRLRQAWADGKYDGVAVGICKWHDHVKPDGTLVKLQGTWELAYAKWLDEHNIEYETHKGRIPYVDNEGIRRSYYPDFYLIVEATYVDVKNPLYEKLHERKIMNVRASNPELRLIILGKQELENTGVI